MPLLMIAIGLFYDFKQDWVLHFFRMAETIGRCENCFRMVEMLSIGPSHDFETYAEPPSA